MYGVKKTKTNDTLCLLWHFGKEGRALHFVLQHTRRAMTLQPLFLLPSLFVNLLSISVYNFGARQTAVVNADLLDAVLEKHRSKR